MDFNDSPEEAAFRAEARSWLDAHAGDFAAAVSDVYANSTHDSLSNLKDHAMHWQKKKAADGWSCLTWPREYGGRGANTMQQVIFSQEEERAGVIDLSSMYIITVGMAGPTIMAHGTPEQKARHLPKIVDGTHLWCQMFSEPAAGSDLAGIKTRAERDGDDWIVNGQKIWTSFAHLSDWAIFVLRTDPTVRKHEGLTYFVIDMKSPGIEIRPIKQASGDSEFNEVFFRDVRLPDANRLGEIGGGWRVAMTTLMSERVAVGTGIPDNIAEILQLARTLRINDDAALQDPAVRQRIADWYVRAAGVKATGLRLMTDLSKGKPPGPEASISKLVVGVGRQNLASFALDLMGPAGMLAGEDSCGWGQYDYFRTIGNRVEGGTDEILRNIIGERILGLPPEHRVDKDVAFNEINR